MTAKRVELKFQDHLIDSYSRQGGYARKWASEWQGGVQDLICSIPPIGLHLIEVKHRHVRILDIEALQALVNAPNCN